MDPKQCPLLTGGPFQRLYLLKKLKIGPRNSGCQIQGIAIQRSAEV